MKAVILNLSKKKRIGVLISIISIIFIMTIGVIIEINLNATPVLKAKSLNAHEIRISWNVVKNAELFNIYRMDEENGEYKKIGTVKGIEFTDTNLKPQSIYWYKITIIRDGKEGKLSTPVKEVTKNIPQTPSEVEAVSQTFDTINITWKPIKGINKYYIYRSDNDNGKFNKVGEVANNTFCDEKLKSTKKYQYEVTAVNNDGESEYSPIAEATTKEKVNQVGNRTNNLDFCGYATEQGDWIYFSTKDQYNSIYKIRKDGTSLTKIYEGCAESLNVIGDWIYFSGEQGYCKIKTDGTQYTKITNEIMNGINIIGDWVYYYTDFNSVGIYKMKIDGSEKVKLSDDDACYFIVDSNWIYYTNISDRNRLYKISTDGSNKSKLNNEVSQDINISGEWIYYCNLNDYGKLYKIKTDGSNRQKVSDVNLNMFNIIGDTIIFENFGDNGYLYKMKTDGSNIIQLVSGHYNYINIVDNYIFCFEFDSRRLLILSINNSNGKADINNEIQSGNT